MLFNLRGLWRKDLVSLAIHIGKVMLIDNVSVKPRNRFGSVKSPHVPDW